jgi:hypothetical protein
MKSADEYARLWFGKAKNENDEVNKFIFLWISLNALYNEYYVRDEKKAIKDFIKKKYIDTITQKNEIESILNDENVSFFKERIIRNMRNITKSTMENAARLKNTTLSSPERLQELLMILYQIRCNLFHGEKWCDNTTDDNIVKKGMEILLKILEVYMDNKYKS